MCSRCRYDLTPASVLIHVVISIVEVVIIIDRII